MTDNWDQFGRNYDRRGAPDVDLIASTLRSAHRLLNRLRLTSVVGRSADVSGETKVGFVVGGVQKAGTTALFRYLEGLPSLSLAPVKECHFFDEEKEIDWSAPDYARYEAMLAPPDGRPRGEATPIYLYWPNALERIARYNRAMKLIFLFRDPVARAWSHWRMQYARGWETEPFAWCIREGRARVDSPEAPGFNRIFSYVERGFYGAQLARALSLFPRKQMLLLRSDTLDAKPDETLARICRFVGAARPSAPVTPRRELVSAAIDYGQEITQADKVYLRGLYAQDLLRFAELSGLPVADWIED